MYKRLFFIFFSLVAVAKFSNGQAHIQESINRLVNDEALAHSSIGICIVDIATGKTIAQYNSGKSLMPASILKILTTSTTLGILGGDYRFKTELSYTGSIDETGTLVGDMYITGYGDPTLGSDRWESLQSVMGKFAGAVYKTGIKCIEGSLIGDGSYFESEVSPPGWQWQDLGNYYGTGAWGLNINENLYKLTFAQTPKEGQRPRITGIYPEIEGLSFVNELTSGATGSGDNAYIYGAPYSDMRFVRGTIPRGKGSFSIKGAIPNAPLFAAQYLGKLLDEEGINPTKGVYSDFSYPGKISLRKARKKIYTHTSPPLREIVDVTNHKSINLFCEVMLKTLGVQPGKAGSTNEGLRRVRAYWEERGLSFDGVTLVDGSGLSRTNLITANFMAKLLRKIALNESLYADFYPSLSIAGKTGYVQSILKNTKAAGNLRAKTGTMESVRSFAGYATMNDGRKVSYCIIVNNFEGSGKNVRQKCAKVMKAICD